VRAFTVDFLSQLGSVVGKICGLEVARLPGEGKKGFLSEVTISL
jgi:hypothetical protein